MSAKSFGGEKSAIAGRNSPPLRLSVFDADDLAVLSTNLQDMLVTPAEMTFLPRSKRFAFAGRRFDWQSARAGLHERCSTGVHFESVLGASRSGFEQSDAGRILNLLAIDFVAGEAPAGTVRLIFSGRAIIRLQVECLEAHLHDLDERWVCKSRPEHSF